jgi:hypothetical protein
MKAVYNPNLLLNEVLCFVLSAGLSWYMDGAPLYSFRCLNNSLCKRFEWTESGDVPVAFCIPGSNRCASMGA